MSDPLFEKEATRQIISLHARIDALSTIIEVLARNAGLSHEKLHHILDMVRETSIQKRLEKIETLSPAQACDLDFTRDLSKIDQSLLDELNNDEKP